MPSALKQIRAILNEHDARDPRGALLAIEQVIANKPKKRKPFFNVAVIASEDKKTISVVVDHSTSVDRNVTAVACIIDALGKFSASQDIDTDKVPK